MRSFTGSFANAETTFAGSSKRDAAGRTRWATGRLAPYG